MQKLLLPKHSIEANEAIPRNKNDQMQGEEVFDDFINYYSEEVKKEEEIKIIQIIIMVMAVAVNHQDKALLLLATRNILPGI